MRAITAAQSEQLALEILDLSVRLLELSFKVRPPWGDRDRIMRLSKERLAAATQDLRP